MANIRKLKGDKGSYQITVAEGRNADGKQIRHYMTWTPTPDLLKKDKQKKPLPELNQKGQRALEAAAVEFESKILDGFAVDNRQTFAQYAEYVLTLKGQTGTKHRTLERYRELLGRIIPALGHKKLTEIRPRHLNSFYANLGESGIRKDGEKAVAHADIVALLKERGLSRTKLAEMAGCAPTTITAITQGRRVSKAVADSVCAALDVNTDKLFTIELNTAPLSVKTILEHHRLISTILRQAEKEMIVMYNATAKATLPKLIRTEARTFQPGEVIAIREALEHEPLKWETLTHLLLVTGCRRGEIAGLAWDRVDWENRQIQIDKSLLYSRTKGVYEDSTKTGTKRFIKLPAETIELLREYRLWYLDLQAKNGDRWKDSGYVFVRDDGGALRPDSITGWLSEFAQRHGLPHVNPHKFRHTMASLLYFGGVDSIAISKRLGHAKVSTTIDIYSHIIDQADANAADCIADVMLRKA